MEKLKIFVSGTQDDMKPEREVVDRAVKSTALATSIRAEAAMSQPQSPRDWIVDQIKQCDIYLGVYSHRYGWVIPQENKSATEFEFDLATSLNKPILVWIRELRETEKAGRDFDRQELFLNKVSDFKTGKLRQVFTTPADLRKWVPEALRKAFIEIIRSNAVRQAAAASGSLPTRQTTFVGRAREVTEVMDILKTAHLVTLVGTGGIGKSRLALQIAGDMKRSFKDGAWFVELASISDPSLVAQTIATTLQVREEPGCDHISTLSKYLKNRDLFLILDNCEHLIETCAQLIDQLLGTCPDLHILVTSREPLAVPGEQLFQVPSLSIPDPERKIPFDRVVQYDATRLFVERAVAVRPSFTLSNENAPVIVQICSHLDGMPLAIELAAARAASMSPVEIRERLKDRFGLLTKGSRTALPRHQTLRATIDWSYDLLSRPERILFRRVSIFKNGWTLPAAEAVCTGGVIVQSRILNLISKLVDKSLVSVDERAGETRYRLLETIREYSTEKLEGSTEAENIRARCLDFYLALSEAADKNLRGEKQGEWLNRLEAEHDNLRSGLEWCEREKNLALQGLRMAVALWRFWEVRGYLSEGRRWLNSMLSSSAHLDEKALRAKALNASGALARGQGDYSTARRLFEESLVLRRELGDKPAIAGVLHNLASVDLAEGKYGAARRLFEECVVLDHESGDRGGAARTLNNLGLVATQLGDLAGARGYLEKSLDIKRELGDETGIASSLGNLGEVARYSQDNAQASKLYRESLKLWDKLANPAGVRICLIGLAAIDVAEGRIEEAARLLGAIEALGERLESPLPASDNADYERSLAAVQAKLDPAKLQALSFEGRNMSPEQITTAVMHGGD